MGTDRPTTLPYRRDVPHHGDSAFIVGSRSIPRLSLVPGHQRHGVPRSLLLPVFFNPANFTPLCDIGCHTPGRSCVTMTGSGDQMCCR